VPSHADPQLPAADDPTPPHDPHPPEAAPRLPALVIALTSDLFIVPRLQDVARALGFEMAVVDRPEGLGASGEASLRPVPLTEPLEGPDAVLMRRLVDRRPALILVDTASDEFPWERWISTLKTSAATRRIPILAFGPHVDTDRLVRAERAGADQVLARGAFLRDLPRLLQHWARVPDLRSLEAACLGPLSARAVRGIEHINAGEYFEAHEELEHAWMEAGESEGFLYRALLQVAVALLQIERRNPRGARKMLLRVREWLDPLPASCRGVDLAAVRTVVAELDRGLEAGSPDLASIRLQIPLPRS
jgi:hypothetical protein